MKTMMSLIRSNLGLYLMVLSLIYALNVGSQPLTYSYNVDVTFQGLCPEYGVLQVNISKWHVIIPPFNGYWEVVASTALNLNGSCYLVAAVPGINSCGQMKITTSWQSGSGGIGIPYEASTAHYFTRLCDGSNPTIFITVPVSQGGGIE